MAAALNWLVDHNYPRGVVNISTPNSGPAAVSAMKRLADANFVVVLSANSGGNVYARFTQALAEKVLVVGGTDRYRPWNRYRLWKRACAVRARSCNDVRRLDHRRKRRAHSGHRNIRV